MQSDAARLGVTLAALGTLLAIIAATLTGLGASWWVWTGYMIWGALWITAALGLGDAASRAFLAGTLRKSTYTQIYTTLTRRLLTPLWTRLCDPAPDKAPWPTQFRAALTWQLYDRALLIAVAYPITFLVGQWIITGIEARIGSFSVLPALQFWPYRAATLTILAIIAASICLGDRLAPLANQHSAARKALAMGTPIFISFLFALAFFDVGTYALAFLVSLAGALLAATLFAARVAGPGAIVVAFAFGCVLAFSDTVEASGADTVAFGKFAFDVTFFPSFTLVFIASVAGVFAVNALHNKGSRRSARIFFTASVIVGLILVALWLDWSTTPEDRRSLFLFLAVLPLLNALFDVISYAATLSLTRRGLQSRLPLLWGLADLALACLLFLALGATLVAAIHALNLLASASFLDLSALFDGIRDTPGDYVWLYLMLFSTILPTALHAALSLLGLQGIWPRPLRRHVATWIDTAATSPLASFRASLALGLIWTMPVLFLMGITAALWWISADAIHWFLARYLDALLWIVTHPLSAL